MRTAAVLLALALAWCVGCHPSAARSGTRPSLRLTTPTRGWRLRPRRSGQIPVKTHGQWFRSTTGHKDTSALVKGGNAIHRWPADAGSPRLHQHKNYREPGRHIHGRGVSGHVSIPTSCTAIGHDRHYPSKCRRRHRRIHRNRRVYVRHYLTDAPARPAWGTGSRSRFASALFPLHLP